MRCAIYTRVSTDEQANKAFGSGTEDDNSLLFRGEHSHLLKGSIKCGIRRMVMMP